jgi:hypothetical protein
VAQHGTATQMALALVDCTIKAMAGAASTIHQIRDDYVQNVHYDSRGRHEDPILA